MKIWRRVITDIAINECGHTENNGSLFNLICVPSVKDSLLKCKAIDLGRA